MALRNRKLEMGNKPVKGVADAVDPKDAVNKSQLDAAVAAIDLSGYVPTSRTLTAGTGLSGGGDLSANRTIDLEDTAVTPGAYTNASITVDQQGRLTAASNGGEAWTLLETIAATSGTSKATSASFAGYREIVVACESISASGAASPNFQMEASGNNGSSWTTATAILSGASAANAYDHLIRASDPNSSAIFKEIESVSKIDSANSGVFNSRCIVELATLTNLRFSFGGGESFDNASGSIKVWGRS